MTFYASTIPARDQIFMTTPLKNKHYENEHTLATLLHGHDISATHMMSQCPVRGWLSYYTHPEGKVYYTQGVNIRLITEADLGNASTARLVEACATCILNWISELYGFNLDPTLELFLDPDVATGACGYYLIDHKAREVFWLTTRNVEGILGLPSICADQKLKLVSEQNYWRHVEMFGEHSDAVVDSAMSDLVAMRLSNREEIDRIFFTRLSIARDTLDLGFLQTQHKAIVLPYIARLWGSIISERIAQLDEDEAHGDSNYSIPFRLVSVLMFGYPTRARSKLDRHIVNNIVVHELWMSSIASHVAKWQVLVQCILGLMNMPSALAVPGSTPIPILTRISLVFGLVGLLTTVYYETCFENMSHDGNSACNFLQRLHRNGRLAVLSISLSVPRALFIWSVILFNAQAFALFFCSVPLSVSIPFCMMFMTFAVAIWWIHEPEGGYKHFPKPPSFIKHFSFNSLRRRRKPSQTHSVV